MSEENSLNKLFEKLKNKNEEISLILNDIINLDIKLNKEQVDLLNNISNNINNTFIDLEKIYYQLLDNNDMIDNINKAERLKEINIQDKINKTFMPYIFLMRIMLENNIN
jgi:hypothetical protein